MPKHLRLRVSAGFAPASPVWLVKEQLALLAQISRTEAAKLLLFR